MLPLLLAVAGGYLIGDSLKSKKFADGERKFDDGGEVERGAASLKLTLRDGVISVYHSNGDRLYHWKAKKGDWDKIWETLRTLGGSIGEKMENGGDVTEEKIHTFSSDNRVPRRYVKISDSDLLYEARKFFKWRKDVTTKRVFQLGSHDYDNFIEYLYKRGYKDNSKP